MPRQRFSHAPQEHLVHLAISQSRLPFWLGNRGHPARHSPPQSRPHPSTTIQQSCFSETASPEPHAAHARAAMADSLTAHPRRPADRKCLCTTGLSNRKQRVVGQFATYRGCGALRSFLQHSLPPARRTYFRPTATTGHCPVGPLRASR